MTDNEKLIEELRAWAGSKQNQHGRGGIIDQAADALEAAEKTHSNTACIAWWEGVNDQWKHRPIGNRILETACPYPRSGATDV